MPEIKRGELWLGHLGQTQGEEQGGKRPMLVVSADTFNQAPVDFITVLPVTTRPWNVRSHLQIEPEESGLDRPSFVMCDQIRTVAKKRLFKRLSRLRPETMETVEDYLRILLAL